MRAAVVLARAASLAALLALFAVYASAGGVPPVSPPAFPDSIELKGGLVPVGLAPKPGVGDSGSKRPWTAPAAEAAGPRGTWTHLDFADPDPRVLTSLVYDSRRKRLLLFGGLDSWRWINETWQFDPAGPGGWQRLAVGGPLPPGRNGHVAVYDPIADAMIVYGGVTASGRLSDVWSLDLAHNIWRELIPAPGLSPPPRSGCVAALDPEQHRLIIAAGDGGTLLLNDVWAFSLEAPGWRQVSPRIIDDFQPSPLTLAFDSRRNRLLAMGGSIDASNADLWAWDVERQTGWARQDFSGQAPGGLSNPCAVYDPVRDRLVLMGGAEAYGAVMTTLTIPFGQPLAATRVTILDDVPPVLQGPSALYDPLHDRVLVFGGTNGGPAGEALWALSLSEPMHWTRLPFPASGGHLGRAYASSVYDPVRQRWIVLFGRSGTQMLLDVWTYDLATEVWTPAACRPSGFLPEGMYGSAAAYDRTLDRVLLFGGRDAGRVYGETWELNMTTGVMAEMSGQGNPPGRSFAAAFYDTTRDEFEMFGGAAPTGGGSEAWAVWSATTRGRYVYWDRWRLLSAVPKDNAYAAGVYDPVAREFVMLGGEPTVPWLPQAWSIRPDDASPRWERYGNGLSYTGHSAVLDAAHRRMLIFGGDMGASGRSDVLFGQPLVHGESPGGILTVGPRPSGRFLHAACFDSEADRMFVFGGATNPNSVRDMQADLWELDLAGVPAWKRLADASFPEPRYSHAALYDEPRDRMLVFSGSSQDPSVWALPLSGPLRWTRLATAGTPPEWRLGPSVVYDSHRDRAILVGGSRGRGQAFKDTWSLTLADPPTWEAIVPRDALPEGGENASGIYDPARDEVLLYGGDATLELHRFEYPHYRHGAFALSLADPTWRPLQIVDGPAGNRTNQAAVRDPRKGEIVSFGGLDDRTGTSCDTWGIFTSGDQFLYDPLDSCGVVPALYSPTAVMDPGGDRIVLNGGDERVWMRQLDGPSEWTPVVLDDPGPAARIEESAVFDTRRNRMLVWAGRCGGTAWADLWQFALEGPPAHPDTPGDRFPMLEPAIAATSPARGMIAVELTLPDAVTARIEVFDLAGRRVAARDAGSLGPGRHRIRLDETAMLPPGVYVLRMTRGGEARSARVVLLR